MAEADGILALGPHEGKMLLVAGDPFVIKVDGANTGGAYSLVEVTVGLHGPPVHLHRNEDELWFVVSGELDIRVGDKLCGLWKVHGLRTKGNPSSLHEGQRGTGQGAEIFSPAGFERFFEEIAGLADVERLRAIAASYGMEMQTPPATR